MKKTEHFYIAPAIEAIAFEAEQYVFSLSSLGDTEELLEDLGAAGKPVLYVYNKCDLLPDFPAEGVQKSENEVYISAGSGAGIDLLLDACQKIIGAGKERMTLFFSYSEQGKISALHADATVESVEYGEEGVLVTAVLDQKARGRYASYIKNV